MIEYALFVPYWIEYQVRRFGDWLRVKVRG